MVQSSCGHGSAAFPILCVVSPVQCGVPGFVSALVLEDFDNCYSKSHLQGFFSYFVLLNLNLKTQLVSPTILATFLQSLVLIPFFCGLSPLSRGRDFSLCWIVSGEHLSDSSEPFTFWS